MSSTIITASNDSASISLVQEEQIMECIEVPRYHLRDRTRIRRPVQELIYTNTKPVHVKTTSVKTITAPHERNDTSHVIHRQEQQPSFNYAAILAPVSATWLHQRYSGNKEDENDEIRWPWVLAVHATVTPDDIIRATTQFSPSPSLTATQTFVQQVAPIFRQLVYVGTDIQECQLYRTWFPEVVMVPRITSRLLQSYILAADAADHSAPPRILIFSRSTALQWRQSPRITQIMRTFLKSAGQCNTLVFVETNRLSHVPSEIRTLADIWVRDATISIGTAHQWGVEVYKNFAVNNLVLKQSTSRDLFGCNRPWACAARTRDGIVSGLFDSGNSTSAPNSDIVKQLQTQMTSKVAAARDNRRESGWYNSNMTLFVMSLILFTMWSMLDSTAFMRVISQIVDNHADGRPAIMTGDVRHAVLWLQHVYSNTRAPLE